MSPGAAHMSKIISLGWGSNTCPTTTDGKFWRNSRWGRTPLSDGQLNRGDVIQTATPLQKQTNNGKFSWLAIAPRKRGILRIKSLSKRFTLNFLGWEMHGPKSVLESRSLDPTQTFPYLTFWSEQKISFLASTAVPFPTNTFCPSYGLVRPLRHLPSRSAYTDTKSPLSIPVINTILWMFCVQIVEQPINLTLR